MEGACKLLLGPFDFYLSDFYPDSNPNHAFMGIRILLEKISIFGNAICVETLNEGHASIMLVTGFLGSNIRRDCLECMHASEFTLGGSFP